MLAAGHRSGNGSDNTGNLLAHPALVWVGDRSYSWYLWHWPVLMLGFAWGMQNRLAESTGLVALSLSLAIISYRWVEQPFWKGRLSQAAPTRIIMLSVLAILMVISGGQNYLRQSTENHQGARTKIAKDARSDIPVIYAYGCDSWYNSSDLQPCVLGQGDARRTVALIGDSVGAQWFSLLPEIFHSPEWRVVILTKSACAMVDEDYFYKRIGQIYTVCTDWRNAALDYLSALKPDLVFLGSASTYDFTEAQWIDGSSRVLARLAEAAGKLIVIPGTPKISFDGPGCLARRAQNEGEVTAGLPSCRESLTSTQDTDVARHLKLATERFPNAMLLDLNDLVCPDRHCSALNEDGIVVFRDNKHLTDSFVRAQIPHMRARLESLGITALQMQ